MKEELLGPAIAVTGAMITTSVMIMKYKVMGNDDGN